jgi:hypothetical protein
VGVLVGVRVAGVLVGVDDEGWVLGRSVVGANTGASVPHKSVCSTSRRNVKIVFCTGYPCLALSLSADTTSPHTVVLSNKGVPVLCLASRLSPVKASVYQSAGTASFLGSRDSTESQPERGDEEKVHGDPARVASSSPRETHRGGGESGGRGGRREREEEKTISPELREGSCTHDGLVRASI